MQASGNHTKGLISACLYNVHRHFMLNIVSRFSSSFAALLSGQVGPADVNGRLKDIRTAMLECLLRLVGDDLSKTTRVWIAIDQACEFQTLWYLRSDMLRAIGDSCGEQVARNEVDEITKMFRGVIPKNQFLGPRRIGASWWKSAHR